jgi:hypothetical protein
MRHPSDGSEGLDLPKEAIMTRQSSEEDVQRGMHVGKEESESKMRDQKRPDIKKERGSRNACNLDTQFRLRRFLEETEKGA